GEWEDAPTVVTADEVDETVLRGDRGEAGAWGEHLVERRPRVGGRVVRLDGRLRLVVDGATERIDVAVVAHRGRERVARRGHARGGRPGVGARRVHLDGAQRAA